MTSLSSPRYTKAWSFDAFQSCQDRRSRTPNVCCCHKPGQYRKHSHASENVRLRMNHTHFRPPRGSRLAVARSLIVIEPASSMARPFSCFSGRYEWPKENRAQRKSNGSSRGNSSRSGRAVPSSRRHERASPRSSISQNYIPRFRSLFLPRNTSYLHRLSFNSFCHRWCRREAVVVYLTHRSRRSTIHVQNPREVQLPQLYLLQS